MHRRVHGVESEVQQEGPGAFAQDEVNRTISEFVGEIGDVRDRLSALEKGVRSAAPDIQVRMLAAQKPVELVEAARHGVELLASTQVPLAEQGRAITRRLQPIGQRRFGQRQAELPICPEIELVSEPLLVTTGQ